MGTYENLGFDVTDRVAIVTLDRPPVNALSMGLYRDIAAAFAEVEARSDEIGAVVVTGAGRCFCAGRDLKTSEVESPAERSKLARASYSALHHSVVPVIAAINGPAMGAGFLSALACDMLVASEDAVFALPEIDAGLNMSVATLLRGFSPIMARRYAFTAERIPPDELYRLGVVASVVPPAALMDEAMGMARMIASKVPAALRETKLRADDVELMWTNFEFAYRAIEGSVTHALLHTEDRIEAGRAFREKRRPVFKGR